MDVEKSEYGIIKEIIRQEMIFYRHYVGEVLDNKDELKKGRLLVAIYELHWDTKANSPWCNPRYISGIRVPEVGDWVEVYFINGDHGRPVWLGIAAEVKDNLLTEYKDETTDVLHENRKTGDAVVYDSAAEEYKIGAADQKFVRGDEAKTQFDLDNAALTQLKIDLAAWVPVPTDGGLALKTILTAGFLTKTLGNYNNILSDKIKGE